MGTISEKLDYLMDTKTLIKTAINDKGVVVTDADTFRSYATKIGQISGGGGGSIQIDELWTGTETPAPAGSPIQIILSDPISDYDLIFFEGYSSDTYYGTASFVAETMTTGKTFVANRAYQSGFFFDVVSDTVINLRMFSSSDLWTYKAIYGVKGGV